MHHSRQFFKLKDCEVNFDSKWKKNTVSFVFSLYYISRTYINTRTFYDIKKTPKLSCFFYRRSRGKLNMLYRLCRHPDLVLFLNKFNFWHFNFLLCWAFIFQYIQVVSKLSPIFFSKVIPLLISDIFPYIAFFQWNGHIPNRI